jgi:hypothetical protein
MREEKKHASRVFFSHDEDFLGHGDNAEMEEVRRPQNFVWFEPRTLKSGVYSAQKWPTVVVAVVKNTGMKEPGRSRV